MISISELVVKLCTEDNNKSIELDKNVVLVLDVSGSTAQVMYSGTSVLTKEIEVMTNYILSNPKNNYELYSFDSNAIYHGRVNILEDEDFVNLPTFKPGSSTNTCSALNLVSNNLNKFKPNKIVIFTDGQTDNSLNYFTPLIQIWKQ